MKDIQDKIVVYEIITIVSASFCFKEFNSSRPFSFSLIRAFASFNCEFNNSFSLVTVDISDFKNSSYNELRFKNMLKNKYSSAY